MEGAETGFTRPIVIKYQPPSWSGPLNVLIHLLAICANAIVDIPLIVKFIIIFIKFVWGMLIIKEWLKQHINGSDRSIRLDMEGNWNLVVEGKKEIKLELTSIGFYALTLLALRFKGPGPEKYSFILTSKNTDSDILRRLRVRVLYP
jgi:hypothetical protein